MARRGERSFSGRKFGGSWTNKAAGLKPASVGSGLEDLLHAQVRAVGLPEPERQVKLLPERKFLWDFAWRAHRLAVEVQGGIYLPKSGHNTASGINRDCEKHNLLLVAGWRPLLVTGDHVRSGLALNWIEKLIVNGGAN